MLASINYNYLKQNYVPILYMYGRCKKQTISFKFEGGQENKFNTILKHQPV